MDSSSDRPLTSAEQIETARCEGVAEAYALGRKDQGCAISTPLCAEFGAFYRNHAAAVIRGQVGDRISLRQAFNLFIGD